MALAVLEALLSSLKSLSPLSPPWFLSAPPQEELHKLVAAEQKAAADQAAKAAAAAAEQAEAAKAGTDALEKAKGEAVAKIVRFGCFSCCFPICFLF